MDELKFVAGLILGIFVLFFTVYLGGFLFDVIGMILFIPIGFLFSLLSMKTFWDKVV